MSSNKSVGTYIYGAGGHGRVVFHTLASCGEPILAFIDEGFSGRVYDFPVYSPSKLKESQSFSIHFAIGNNLRREKLQTEWLMSGIKAKTIIHPKSTCYTSATLGDGVLIATGAIVGPECVIGDGCIINHSAIVDHDCRIGGFCHIAPSVTIGGAVVVGSNTLIGAGAIISPNLTIGSNVTISPGSIVIQDIPEGVKL